MAIPFLSTLSKSARTIYPQVLSGVKQGLSSRAIERSIRAAGFPVSRSRTLLPMMRAITEVERRGAAVKNIGLNRSINVNRLPVSLTPLRRRYSYTVRVRGINSVGDIVDQYLTYSTNSSTILRKTIEERVLEIASTGQSGEALEDIQTTLVHGTRANELI